MRDDSLNAGTIAITRTPSIMSAALPHESERCATTLSVKRLFLPVIVLLAVIGLIALGVRAWRSGFPADTTPAGAYLRVAKGVNEAAYEAVFPYLEQEAQWALYSIVDLRAKACALIRKSYPEPEKSKLLTAYATEAEAGDGATLFARIAEKRGWIARLRKDMSGIEAVEERGERASVITVHGTRYPFRRRDNGMWGLTLYTAELVEARERAARDLVTVEAAAEDYDRAAKRVE